MAKTNAERIREYRQRKRALLPVEVRPKLERAVMPRTLSKQEARVVLTLEENHQKTVTRQEVIEILKAGKKAADHVISALREKGWLERVHWGRYELIPFDQGSSTIFCDKNHEMNAFLRR